MGRTNLEVLVAGEGAEQVKLDLFDKLGRRAVAQALRLGLEVAERGIVVLGVLLAHRRHVVIDQRRPHLASVPCARGGEGKKRKKN